MTKKGFGEMVITGSIASAIFCILVGLGQSTYIPLFKNFLNYKPSEIVWIAFNADVSFEKSSIVPLILIIPHFFNVDPPFFKCFEKWLKFG